MLIELLSMSNYGHFNIKLAQILGLETAIYLSEIMNINEKAIRKEKIEEDFFTIDRNYIEKRTTISAKKQEEIEKTLLKIGILEKTQETSNTICLNINILTSILMNPDEKLIKNINKIIKQNSKSPRMRKDEAIKQNLKNQIFTTNDELTAAYGKWIEAVYDKEGWMSTEAIVAAQEIIDNFSNRNLDLALNIIRIATINGYRDMSWAIKAYKKDYNIPFRVCASVPSPIPAERPEVSDEVF